MYYQAPGTEVPSANIAVNRNRLKHYGDKVYLKNKTHFEIELFNPKTTKVLAKIYLNGVAISSSGIVLRPGQRVFLERWLDEPKKFLFETYDVENSKQAIQAIEKNGKVRVEFFDEIIQVQQVTLTTWPNVTFPSCSPVYGGVYNTADTNAAYFSSSISGASASNDVSSNGPTKRSKSSIETGRAEKGESSNQAFTSDSSTYSSWCTASTDLQILPESSMPVESNQIRNYCHNCGTRVKTQNWKFCPKCGTKLN